MKSVIFFLLILNISRCLAVDPLVLTSQGLVQGTISSDGEYSLFLGIPYATVDPNNPFGEALPGPQFNDVFEAIDDSSLCPQREEINRTLAGSLDCLRLNVYVPSSASSTNLLPVIVWIYGGGFSIGISGQIMHGPQNYIRHDVILVTFNYRIGPYGFMCLDIPSVPGNSGLKDQLAALRWVNNNIAAFGGDVNRITAGGGSAGAMSLGLHIISPGSNGLFHQAIMQSGSSLVEGLVRPSRPSVPLEIANYLGFSAISIEDALEILKDVHTDDVIRAVGDLGLSFRPCVEIEFEGVNHVLVTNPDITLESGQYESVPILIGFNSHEQLGGYIGNRNNEQYFAGIERIFYNRINGTFAFIDQDEFETAARIVQEFYIGSKAVNADVLFELSDFDSDMHFVHPIDRLVEYHLEKSENPIYQYMFAYSGGLNYSKRQMNITEGGAIHGDDRGYMFRQFNTPEDISPEDQLMIDWMTTMWTNFVKYGDPTPAESALLPVRWPAATTQAREFLLIDRELVVGQKPVHDRIAFWDLFFNTFKNYYIYY